MDYFNDDDTDMLGDQNMLSHDNTNGGHLFDDTKFNIWSFKNEIKLG